MTIKGDVLLDNNMKKTFFPMLKAHLLGFFSVLEVLEIAFFDAMMTFVVAS